MEIVELSHQQSARMDELPESYRVVGVDHRAPLVRKPSGQVIRVERNGRLGPTTIPARSRPGNGIAHHRTRAETASWNESSC
jgi:hypothetical protein